MVKEYKNINLVDVKNYKMPITAISSILHRISGIVLIILLPFVVWGMYESLGGEHGFIKMHDILFHSFASLFLWGFLVAITYHVLAGIRHVIMDIGFGEDLSIAKKSSVIIIVLGAIFAILWGVWIWL